MAQNSDLFLLIKSLSKAEKRHFKLFCSAYSGGKNHLKLFDAIDKQERYDEAQIKKKFRQETFVKQLHVTKSYLNQMILKSLRSFHGELSVDAVIKDQLRDLEILYKKGLYQQCEKVVEKAIKTATRYEKHASLAELLRWKRVLLLAKNGSSTGAALVAPVLQQEHQSLKVQQNLNDYWLVCVDLINAFVQEGNTPESEARREELVRHPLLQNEQQAQSLQALSMFHFVNYTKSVFSGSGSEGYRHASLAVEAIEKRPLLIADDPLAYSGALNNLIPICFREKRYHEVQELIQKAKAIPRQYPMPAFSNFYFKHYLRSYNHELELHRDLVNIKEGLDLAEEVEQFMQEYEHMISLDYQVLFSYQMAFIYFMSSKYSQALRWVNRVLNTSETSRTDIHAYTRILHLMTHYELKHYDIIESLTQSTRRYLNKRNRLYEFELAILRFFRHVSLTDNHEAIAKLEELKNRLLELNQSSNDELDFINILAWIQSKLNRTSYANVLLDRRGVVQKQETR